MRFLRDAIHVDETAYQLADPRDKSLINIMALFTPISAGIVGYAIYYCIIFLTDYFFVSAILGVLASIAFYYHDTTLLGTFKRSAIYVRLIFSFLLIAFVSIPIKMDLVGEDVIKQKLTEINQVDNERFEKELYRQKQEIYNEHKAIKEKVIRAAEQYDRTGKAQQLSDARRLEAMFLETKDERIQALEKSAEMKMTKLTTSRVELAGYYAVNMFDLSSPSELLINMIVLVLALLFETLPVLVRMGIEGGHFMRAKEHIENLSKKADEGIWEVDQELMEEEGIENLTELLLKRALKGEMKNQLRKNFSDTKNLVDLAEQVKGLKSTNGQQPPSDTNGESNGNKNSDGGDIPEFKYDS